MAYTKRSSTKFVESGNTDLDLAIKDLIKAHLNIINGIKDITYNDFLMSFNPMKDKIIPFPYLEPEFNIEETILKEKGEEVDHPNKAGFEEEKENNLHETCIPTNVLLEEEEETILLNDAVFSNNKSLVKNNEFSIKSQLNNTIKQQPMSFNLGKNPDINFPEMSIFISLGDKNIVIDRGSLSHCYLSDFEKKYILKIYKIYNEYQNSKNI